LKQKLEDFEILALYEASKDSSYKSLKSVHENCNFSYEVSNYVNGLEEGAIGSNAIEMKRVNAASLVELVLEEDTSRVNCEKLNAVKTVLEEAADYYEVKNYDLKTGLKY